MIDPDHLARLQGIGLNPSLQRAVLQTLSEHDDDHRSTDPDARPCALEPWRVVEVQRSHVLLHDGRAACSARLLPKVVRALLDHDDAVAVGDWVLAAPDAQGDVWVHARVPPMNHIARRLHDGRDKVSRAVIVANVDTALLTMGLDADFNLRRLERYLALARLAAVEPLVVLTKADLCSSADSRLDAVRAMLPPLTQALAVNGLDEHTVRAALLPWLQPARTLVLLGSSGAGKSTLTNALVGHATQDTGPVRAGDSRGRHTTTVRTLHRLPGGACVIDTPGLRTLRLDTDEAQLLAAFDEVATLAKACRFRDCRHESEPGCAVRDGVAPERLKTFRKLGREAARDSMTLLDRQREHALWRQRSRASRALSKARSRAGS